MSILMQPTLALSLPEAGTFEEWSSLSLRLCSAARTINWLIGDWFIAGAEQIRKLSEEVAR